MMRFSAVTCGSKWAGWRSLSELNECPRGVVFCQQPSDCTVFVTWQTSAGGCWGKSSAPCTQTALFRSRWTDLWVICFHYGNMQFSPSFHYDNIMTVILWTDDDDAFFSPPLCPDIGLNTIEMTELSVIRSCRFSPEQTNAATWSG